jgi:glycosyltransferase involved in cell wall biosynthesis
MDKHILFLSYDGMTDPLGQSQVLPYLIGLTKAGYRFTIISCDKDYNYKLNASFVNQLIQPYPIKWISLPYHKKPQIVSSVIDFLAMKKAIKQLMKKDPVAMVHTRPGIPNIAALWMKKKYNCLFYYDIRGFWADERKDGGQWNVSNPIYKLVYGYFKKIERRCMRNADAISCLTYAAKKEMERWPVRQLNNVPIEVIPCSVDLAHFNFETIDQERKQAFAAELNITANDKVFTYLGSLGGWYLTNEMLQLCAKIEQAIPEAKFLFITQDSAAEVYNAAKQFGLSKEKIIVKLGKRNDVPILLSFSFFALFFIKPCYSKISSSPTKHGEIMAMGIPVISNSGVGDVAEIINNSNTGFVIENFDEQALKNAIDFINSYQPNKVAIRASAQQYYALPNAINTYVRNYAYVFGKKTNL